MRIAPVHRSNACFSRPFRAPTYAEHLTRENARRPRPLPTYAEHLRRVNEELDIEARRLNRGKGQPAAAAGDGPRTTGGTSMLERAGSLLPPPPSHRTETVLHAVYQVRVLLNRGAILDLAG